MEWIISEHTSATFRNMKNPDEIGDFCKKQIQLYNILTTTHIFNDNIQVVAK